MLCQVATRGASFAQVAGSIPARNSSLLTQARLQAQSGVFGLSQRNITTMLYLGKILEASSKATGVGFRVRLEPDRSRSRDTFCQLVEHRGGLTPMLPAFHVRADGS